MPVTLSIGNDDDNEGSTDELSVTFYTCPSCLYKRVPHGHYYLDPEDEHFRNPEYDARFCPGCGTPVRWVK